MSNSQSHWNQNKTLKRVKKPFFLAHLSLILLLIFIIAVGAVPGYLKGAWSWTDIPKVANIKPLKNIIKNGLTLVGWKTLRQQEILLGGNQWSVQIITQGEEEPIILLLMPQDYYMNKPGVEWTDVNSLEHWKTDSHTQLKFTTKNGQKQSSPIIARFFRAWTQTTTAVVQWYAWPGGGNFSPSHWFWLDQWAQLHQQRVPWVAVCLQIPINPLSSLKDNQQEAISLAQIVQTTLEEKIFKPALRSNPG